LIRRRVLLAFSSAIHRATLLPTLRSSGAEREYEYEPGGIDVTPIPRTVRCLEGDQRASPFATIADAMTDGRLVHQVFNGSHFSLCGHPTDAMRPAHDPTIPHCQKCEDLAPIIGAQA
jgi:hypothetical protein